MYAGRDGGVAGAGGREVRAMDKGIFGALAFGCMIALTILIILYRPVVRIEFQDVKNPVTVGVDDGEPMEG